MGPVDFHVDGEFAGTVDCSKQPPRFAEHTGDDALKTQLLFESDILSPGDHSVSLVIKESLGEGRGVGAGIEAFDFTDAEFSGDSEGSVRESGYGHQQDPDTCPAEEEYVYIHKDEL